MTKTPDLPIFSPEDIKQSRIIDLTLYKNNPRVHSDVQIERLAISLQEFGFTNPVLVDDLGNVVCGHGRIAAAKKNRIGDSSYYYTFTFNTRSA